MKLSKIQEKLKLVSHQEIVEANIEDFYTSDLLSDILANAPEKSLIITIQAHKNTLAIATLKKSPAIIICNNREITEDFLSIAKENNIQIFSAHKNQFEISGEIYALKNEI